MSATAARTFAQNFGGVLRGGLYVNRDATMLNFIGEAYGVSEDGLSGGPGWLSSDLFDVIAKVPDGTTQATAKVMLQSLLTERFKLVIHNGTSPLPRYVLTVGKGGSKLKPSSGSDAPGCQQVQQPGDGGRGGPPDPASVPDVKVVCHNLNGEAIADNLHRMAGGYFDHDVIDSTKLEGSWDFELEWTPRAALAAKGSNGTSVFAAVEKQLGLKAELQNVPIPSLVIESVNRKPTPNPEGIATALALPAARFEAATIKPANPDQPPFVGLIYAERQPDESRRHAESDDRTGAGISPNIAADMLVGIPKSADATR